VTEYGKGAPVWVSYLRRPCRAATVVNDGGLDVVHVRLQRDPGLPTISLDAWVRRERLERR
jgi:hypothetical protein